MPQLQETVLGPIVKVHVTRVTKVKEIQKKMSLCKFIVSSPFVSRLNLPSAPSQNLLGNIPSLFLHSNHSHGDQRLKPASVTFYGPTLNDINVATYLGLTADRSGLELGLRVGFRLGFAADRPWFELRLGGRLASDRPGLELGLRSRGCHDNTGEGERDDGGELHDCGWFSKLAMFVRLLMCCGKAMLRNKRKGKLLIPQKIFSSQARRPDDPEERIQMLFVERELCGENDCLSDCTMVPHNLILPSVDERDNNEANDGSRSRLTPLE